MIQHPLYLETAPSALQPCLIEPVADEETRLIQQALHCLENRIKYASDTLRNPSDMRDYLRLQLVPEPNEVFGLAPLK